MRPGFDCGDLRLREGPILLEPLEPAHGPDLLEAALEDPSVYSWSPVPTDEKRLQAYLATAFAWRTAGTSIPLVVRHSTTSQVLGCTRFFNIERWGWAEGHPRRTSGQIDVCEIGYTWYRASALGSGANKLAKYLMLKWAFETAGALRVCFYAHVDNLRSAAALDRLGATFEGVVRQHRPNAWATEPRDSRLYSVIDRDWPAVRAQLEGTQSISGQGSPGHRSDIKHGDSTCVR